MNHDDAHGLRVQLATASALADEWRAKANQLLALCGRLEGDLTEARAGRDNWKEACRKTEQERDSRDWTGLQSECDALRAENGRLREELAKCGNISVPHSHMRPEKP